MKNFTIFSEENKSGWMKVLLVVVGMVFSIYNYAQTTQTFSTSGSYKWICPTNVTSIQVECWGAGGGGGGTNNPGTSGTRAGGGGAGGSYTKKTNHTVVPGTVYTIYVGTGGSAGSSSGGNGGKGEDSYFGSASTILAVGGNGGNGATSNGSYGAGGSAVSSGNVGGSTNYYGGGGATGSATYGGGSGSSAGTSSGGNSSSNGTGASAVTGGVAGVNGPTASGNGSTGNTGGGGGSGAVSISTGNSYTGGVGGVGKVVITYTLTSCNNIFEQDFSASSTLTDFITTSTNSPNQFDESDATLNSGALSTTGTICVFAGRLTDLPTTPTSMLLEYDLTVSGVTAGATNSIITWIGDGLPTGTVSGSNSQRHDQIIFSTNSSSPSGFAFRNQASASTGTYYSGKVRIYTNNSGSTITYYGPDGNSYTLADDVADVWIGSNLVADEYSSNNTTTVALKEFKIMLYSTNTCTRISVDNIVVNSINATPPTATAATNVNTTSFSANWGAVSNACKYYLDVSTNSSFSSFVSGFNNLDVGNVTTYNVTGLSSETVYYYRVRSVLGSYTSVSSNTITVGTGCSSAKSGTLKIGPGGGYTADYTTLSQALYVLRSGGCSYTGNIILELQSDYVSTNETFPLDFTGLGASNATITIRPASGATGRSISGSNATAIFDLLGADYITVDGRAGGTGSTSVLTISNTNTGGSVFRFTNGSTYNTVKYCTINSAATSTVATVLFGTTSNSTGNSNNTIDNCTIAPSSSTQKYAIESTGTATYENATNTISNCQIKDFSDDGIYINSNSDAWEINGNHLYVTSGSIGGSAAGTNIYSCVYINSGDGYTVSNNFLGGKAANCGGGYLNCINNATGDNILYGLYLGSGLTGASSTTINNNFIKYLSSLETQTTLSATVSGILLNSSSTTIVFYENEVTHILCAQSKGPAYITTPGTSLSSLSLTMHKNKFDFISTGSANGNGQTTYAIDLSDISSGTMKLYNNIFKVNIAAYTGNATSFGTGTWYIYNNNFYYTGSAGANGNQSNLKLSTGNYTIYNNIMILKVSSSGNSSSNIFFSKNATITHNNNYYENTNAAGTYTGSAIMQQTSPSISYTATSFANWEGSTATNSITGCTCSTTTGTGTGKNSTGLTLNTEGKATSTTNIDNYGKDLDADGNIAVTTDYYGITRHATTPDIGAIEDNTTAWYSLTPTSNTAAQTTTNWISQRISNFNAGTISTTSGNTAVTGSGTSFSSQCAVGDKIYHSNGTLIGTISAIGSATSITLTSGASGTYSAINYVAGTQPSDFTTSTQIFKIQPGHQYQATSTWTGAASNKVIVESGGALDINAQSIATWGSFELEGNGVSSSGALYNGSSSPATFSIPIKLTADATVTSSGSGGLTVSGNVTIGTSDGNYPLTINGSNATTIQTGVISGTTSAGELIKEGTGTLTLSGDNTYVGATTINGGTVKLGAAGGATNTPLGTTGAGTVVNSGASLDLNGYTLGTTEGLTINGTGVSSVGALTNSTTTAVTWSGTVALGDATNNYIGTSGNATTGTLTVSGVISGSNPLQIVNTGATKSSIILSGNNTYTGLTTISSGTLKLGATGDATNTPLGTTGAGTVVSSGAVLDLAGYTLGTAEALSLAGTGISSSGALMNSGSACSYSGLITLTAASSIIGGTGTINISNVGTITGATFGLTLGGAQGGTLASILGTTSGTLTKQDAGTWTLSGASTFTGNTVVQQGTLTMGAANALPITSSAGTIQFTTNANSILNLGTFDLGSSSATANSAGQLDFDVNTRVDLGSSGTNGYYFKASNGQTWSATAITIYNWTGTAGSSGTGPKIYIGSDASGLSAGQLALITFNGYTAGAAILSTGEVVPMSLVATITLASNTISAGDNCASSTKVPIQSFSLAVTNGDGDLTNLSFTTTGSYAQADITKYQLWYHTTNDLTAASQLGSDLSSSGIAGARTFTAFTSPTLTNSSTYYFWITVDVASGATNNATIAVNAITTSDLTSTSTKAGTTSAGGTQTLKTLPNITTHPSAATICVGGTYSPTVVASGGVTLSYQWQFSTNGSTGWASVADGTPTNSTFTNATTTTLSQTGNIAAGSAYYYRCVVSSTGNGCSNVNSNAAQLTINAVPTISVQPSAGTICVGGTYSPSVTATGGTSLTYQWQYATSNGGSYANVANSTPANATYTNGTTATLTVAGSIAAGSGNYYKCIVSDAGSGCSSVTSNEVQLTINAVPSISVQPSAGTICVGGTYSPSVTATGGTSLTYQWQYATSNGGSYANVANSTPANATYTNGTTATLTVAGSIAAGSGNYYKCVVSDAGSGCSSVTSNEVQLTINAVPAISVQPSDVTITEGGTYSPSITATGGVSLSYQWQYATTSGGVYSSVANNTPTNASYASATTNNMTMTGSVSAGTYYYKCYVTSTGSGCSAVLSNVSILTINTGVTTFYFSGSGVLSDKTNWGSNTNGTGTNPTNLTGNNLTFYVTHNTTNTPSTDASWTLGSGSKIIVGDGTNATNFNVGHTISGGTIDVSDNATLTISADTPPTLGTLANTSTVVFNGGALQNITIASGKTFGKLTLNNSNGATLTDNATIENTLTLTSGKLIVPASGTLNLGTTSTNLTMSGGSGSSYIVTTNNTSTIKRYINSNTSYVFPIGDASYYTPITYTLNSNTGLSSDYINVYVVDGVTPGFVTSNFSAYITRYWSVSPSSSARLSNYTVAYTYDNSDIVGTESTIIPVKVSGTTWYKPSNAVNITNGTPDGTGSIDIASNTLTWSNLTTYSFDTGAGDEAAALPIHLLYFTAKPEAKKVRLDWATASETNNDYFTVERSQDGEHFNELFKKPGAGISTTNLYYFGYDNKPLPGTSYYRLKQTDYDGKFAYSDVESVSLYGSDRENTIELKIYPNPAENGKFNVNFDAKQSEKYSISIYDAVGKLIYHQDYQAEKGINDYTIELPDLASGMYQLEVRNDNVGVITKSIEF